MKFNYIFYLLALFLIFFATSVNASSSYATVPDVCLPYNVTGLNTYKIWLWDYYTFDFNEVVEIRYNDPLNGNLIRLPANYASLNLDYFEISYGFEDRGNGWYEDVINLQTYSRNYSGTIRVLVGSDSNLDQSFILTVSANCYTAYTETNAQTYNLTQGIFSRVKSYYPFNGNVRDYAGSSNAINDTPSFYGSGKYGQSLKINASTSVNINSSLLNLQSNNYSLSFWLYRNFTTSSSLSYIISSQIQNLYMNNSFFSWCITGFCNYSVSLPSNNAWHFITLTKNSTGHYGFIDGTLKEYYSGGLDFANKWMSLQSPSGNVFYDDFIVWNYSLSFSDISYLYSSGNGINMSIVNPNLPDNLATLPDVNMNVSSSRIINLTQYYANFTGIYVTALDPLNDYTYKLYPGYSTINGDYFEIYNYANYLNITSYQRPYSYDITVYVCQTVSFMNCTSDIFTVNILGALSNVTQVNNFEGLYDLGTDDIQTFAGNYFFQYYDSIVFSFPESNLSGVLDGNYNYSLLDSNSTDRGFMVYLSCNIEDDYYTYNYFGDINVTVECGNLQSYFIINPYGTNYSDKVYFTARNSFSSLSDFTNIKTGISPYPDGFIPRDFQPNTDALDENVYSFGRLLPQDLSQKAQHRLVFLSIFALVVAIFSLGLAKVGFTFCFWSSLAVSILLLFFFASQSYVTYLFPVLILVLTLIYLGIKFTKGGG